MECECMEEGILKEGMASWYDEETELPFVNHKPGECKCTNELKQYWRDGKKIWLCSCCCVFADKEVEEDLNGSN